MLSVACPSCGSNDTYYSAIWLSWKCERCETLFERPRSTPQSTRSSTPRQKAERKPKLVLQVGEKDKSGGVLLRREPVGGLIHDIWQNPQGTRFIFAIPKTDNTGTVISRHKTIEEANVAFEEKLAECQKKEEPEQSSG